ncbi:TrkA C-terminal domain-containing protein [Hydrogenoanaerobacterium sp.]|uniref:TrkA C-terminal domain-containing protein n=1 Tax=Hydrogenoanaerobacterium sp. TaxID=2953763 RepID=UPI00289CF4E7|nr:TrkA C-terminal domain-containing protein [Hydrogenoanaerobacterium sp.]
MRNNPKPPVYSQVAFDIATKIASGELAENSKFTGRSLMSTEYGVSQETIRRAFKQLADMEIISVQQNIGATVLSRKNAVEYIEKFETGKDIRSLKAELRALLDERGKVNTRIIELVNQITDLGDRFKSSDPLRNYEFEILPGSHIIGKSVRELEFWQNTEATIVAIKSEGKINLSPGPNAIFKPYDILVVAGKVDSVDKVKELVK